MEKKFNFVYITTNLINGKQYIGDHSTNVMDDGYMGSGKMLVYAIKKYGKQNFKCEILENFNTKQEASIAQENYINEYNTIIPRGYNISPKGGHQFVASISIETKKKMSLAKKGKSLTETHIKNRTIAQKGKKRTTTTCINISNALKGKKLSEEHKQKLREKKLSQKTKEKISNSLKGRIPWNKGIPASEESKRKNSESHKGNIVSEETRQKISKNSARNAPWKGKKMPEEIKQKMIKSRTGKKRGPYKNSKK